MTGGGHLHLIRPREPLAVLSLHRAWEGGRGEGGIRQTDRQIQTDRQTRARARAHTHTHTERERERERERTWEGVCRRRQRPAVAILQRPLIPTGAQWAASLTLCTVRSAVFNTE
eukprot:COSAG03_NODE_5174_length_1325_cov_5.542414_2_plen_115_part_00